MPIGPKLAPACGVSLLLAVSSVIAHAQGAGTPATLDSSFAAFWRAPDAVARESAGRAVVASGASFDTLLARLRAGRSYARAVPTGTRDVVRVDRQRREFPARIVVPASYDPSRRYPVRVWLHGGVNTPGRSGHTRWNVGRYADSTRIVVFPAGWNDALWWTEAQVDNIAALLDDVRQKYNIDENRTTMMGISDGATGALFYAMHAPTRWASYVSLIGHAAVLANPVVGADAPVFASNLRGSSIFMVNDGHDPLYPAADVARYVPLYRSAGVDLAFKIHQEAGHEVSWLPQDAPAMDAFIAAHPCHPYPDRLSWAVAGDGRYLRTHWVVIRELGRSPKERQHPLARFDRLPGGQPSSRSGDDGHARRDATRDRTGEVVFPWPPGSGRVDVERTGNTIVVETENVKRFALLLSPDQLDLSQPIRVMVNGERLFDGRVEPDAAALLRWAARDDDRTMLFAAELEVEVGRGAHQVK